MLYDDGTVYKKRSVQDLYHHRSYIDPEYGDWESWYAWYPINRIVWTWVPEVSAYLKLTRWEWRIDLLRRKVSSRDQFNSEKRKIFWEYTTMMEMLRDA